MSDNVIDLFQSLSSLSQLKNSCKRNSVVLADERSELVRIQDLQYTFDMIGREVKRGKPVSQFIVRIWELAELLRDDDDVGEVFGLVKATVGSVSERGSIGAAQMGPPLD